mmetsp:Transcript_35701/g.89810  ORF Transcript_35701/g.89810 Transcript_35701/m.89810 type:complete len:319 (+) Transcript_35701:107-1063(+)
MGQCNAAARSTEGEVEEIFSVPAAGFSIRVRSQRKFGWKPDLPDFRDKVLALPESKTTDLPTKVDLRPAEHFTIYDQGYLGSCTANAIGAAFHFDQIRQGCTEFVPSRLFIYYNERAMEGNVDQDAGAYIRDGIKSIAQIGVCHETMWPYDVSRFTDCPKERCYTDATLNKCKSYARVPQTLEDMKGVINEGFPFVFGFAVFESFMTAEVAATGVVPMPSSFEAVLGGHAVQACGYDDEKQWFIVRNSWGEEWGDKGYFYLPYEYMANPQLVGDMWAILFVDSVDFPCRPQPGGNQEKSAAVADCISTVAPVAASGGA